MTALEQYKAQNRARDARKAGTAETERQAIREAEIAHVWWWNHPDRIIKYTGWLSAYTLALFVATLLLFIGSVITVVVLNRQLTVMEADQRPWVSLESVNLSSSLIFDDKGLRLSIDYELKNVGRSPALDTRFYAVAVPVWTENGPVPTIFNPPADIETADAKLIVPHLDPDPSLSTADMAKVQRILCEKTFELTRLMEDDRSLIEQSKGEHVEFQFYSVGNAVFPQQSGNGHFRIVGADTGSTETKRPPPNAKSYNFALTACVRYVEAETRNVHYTQSGYMLFGIYPRNPIFDTTFAVDRSEIPANELRLRLGGRYAD
jgi:hypothetical protein